MKKYRCTGCGFVTKIKPEHKKGECPKYTQHYYIEVNE